MRLPFCPKLPDDRTHEQALQTGTPLFVKYVQNRELIQLLSFALSNLHTILCMHGKH